MSGLKPVSDGIRKLTARRFTRKFVLMARMLEYWPEIVGADMAAFTRPVKTRTRKNPADAGAYLTVLDIGVESAQATVLQYRKGLMIERINRILGERRIADIRFVHMAANTRPARPAVKAKPPLCTEKRRRLGKILENIGDDELRQRLDSLGESVLKDESRT